MKRTLIKLFASLLALTPLFVIIAIFIFVLYRGLVLKDEAALMIIARSIVLIIILIILAIAMFGCYLLDKFNK